jgi:hypothetical protein
MPALRPVATQSSSATSNFFFSRTTTLRKSVRSMYPAISLS